MAIAPVNVVEFNCGGTRMAAARTTIELLGPPLSSMLLGHMQDDAADAPCMGVTLDKDGLPFLDADPALFRLILNHARCGALPEGPQQRQTLLDLRAQAAYFCLEPLLARIDEELARQRAACKAQRYSDWEAAQVKDRAMWQRERAEAAAAAKAAAEAAEARKAEKAAKGGWLSWVDR